MTFSPLFVPVVLSSEVIGESKGRGLMIAVKVRDHARCTSEVKDDHSPSLQAREEFALLPDEND